MQTPILSVSLRAGSSPLFSLSAGFPLRAHATRETAAEVVGRSVEFLSMFFSFSILPALPFMTRGMLQGSQSRCKSAACSNIICNGGDSPASYTHVLVQIKPQNYLLGLYTKRSLSSRSPQMINPASRWDAGFISRILLFIRSSKSNQTARRTPKLLSLNLQ